MDGGRGELPNSTLPLLETRIPMPARAVHRPVVRSFKKRFSREAAAWVRAGGHAFVWENERRAFFAFAEPDEGDEQDLGAWGVYDMGKWRWKVHDRGVLAGLATTLVPRGCIWIAKRRTERDAVHRGPTRRLALDCTRCAACCRDNEVVLQDHDVARFVGGGRPELAKPPYARRHRDGRVILTLLADKRCRHLEVGNRCGIYELRPHACSEFPPGSECCLFAREDVLGLHDGAMSRG